MIRMSTELQVNSIYMINDQQYTGAYLMKAVQVYEKELNRKKAYAKQKYVPKNRRASPTLPLEIEEKSAAPNDLSTEIEEEPNRDANLRLEIKAEPNGDANLPLETVEEPNAHQNLPLEIEEEQVAQQNLPLENVQAPTIPSKFPAHLRTDFIDGYERKHGELICEGSMNYYRTKEGKIIYGIPKLSWFLQNVDS